MIIGYPGTGKTYAALAAMIALMLDRPVWGCPDFRPAHPCRVLLADFDAGERATRKRIRRLLAGMRVTREEIDTARAAVAERRGEPCAELFEVETDPALRYAGHQVTAKDTAAFERAWCDVARSFDVVFIDSLRKVAPALDENDSRSGEVVEALRRVSERTGTAIVLIHHAGRMRLDGKKPVTEAGRGTSAFDGAAGAQIVIALEDGRRRCVMSREAQEADRAPPSPWYLELVRVDDSERGLGHRIEYRTPEQVKPPEAAEQEDRRTRDAQARDRARILEALRQHAGTEGVRGADALCTLAGMKPARGRGLIAAMMDKEIANRGTSARPRLFLGPNAVPSTPNE
jgi:hypothetical protein